MLPEKTIPALLIVLATAWMGAPARAQERAARRYALIVANNHSLDANIKPLSFADDDGAKFYELFAAMSAETALFAVLDADAQRRFPEATAVAKPPKKALVLARLAQMFEAMKRDQLAGLETELYFVYSGHGSMGPNREGILFFLDAPFGRSQIFSEILARSPATFNHLILDACHSYFVVEKRGGREDRVGNVSDVLRRFLRSEELVAYPNTGVILAASSESETHEWNRWRAGIFSHELRSAMLGAADVDTDGRITYAEAAAAIEAANVAVDDPQARLRVYARPPPMSIDRPLIDLAWLSQDLALRFDRGIRGHFHVADSRGLRLADIHPSGEHSGFVVLVGQPPFYVRNKEDAEAAIPAGRATVAMGSLEFRPRAVADKGFLDAAYQQNLYAVPYGPGFFHGFVAASGPGSPEWDGWYGSPGPSPTLSVYSDEEGMSLSTWGWLGVGLGAGSAVAGVVFGVMANNTHNEYLAATDTQEALRLKKKSQQQTTATNVLFVGAGVFVAAGVTVLLLDLFGDAPELAPAVSSTDGGALFTVSTAW